MVMDSAAEHMFEIELISSSRDFMIPKSNKIAITDKLAKEVFGTKDPLGEKLKIWSDDMEICAIVKSQDQHSNPVRNTEAVPTNGGMERSLLSDFYKGPSGNGYESF